MDDIMDEESSFTVRDRRRTSEGGAPPPAETPPAPAAQPSDRPAPEAPRAARPEPASSDRSRPVSFAELVIGLGTSALAAMGVQLDESGRAGPDAGGGRPADLAQARHLIDMLAMLEQKTAGNLAPDEAALLQQLLYSLRLAFVDKSRAGGASSGTRQKESEDVA